MSMRLTLGRLFGRSLTCMSLLAIGLVACGGTTDPAPTQDTSGAATTDTNATADTTDAMDAATDATADTALVVKDQCQNTQDLDWLKSDVGEGKTGRELARKAAGDCGLACLNHPSPDKCAIKCMVESKGVKLTNNCAGCYGGIVLCTIQNCFVKCIDDPHADICKTCQETKGCQAKFDACTGPLPK